MDLVLTGDTASLFCLQRQQDLMVSSEFSQSALELHSRQAKLHSSAVSVVSVLAS